MVMGCMGMVMGCTAPGPLTGTCLGCLFIHVNTSPLSVSTTPYHSPSSSCARWLQLWGWSLRTSGARMDVIMSHSAWWICMHMHACSQVCACKGNTVR